MPRLRVLYVVDEHETAQCSVEEEQRLTALGKAILSLPELREVSGDSLLFHVGMAAELSSWHQVVYASSCTLCQLDGRTLINWFKQ